MSSVLMAKLGVDASGMDQGLAQGKAKVEKAAGDVDKIAKRSREQTKGGLIGEIGKGLAGLLVVDKLAGFARGLMDMAGNAADMSENLGVSVEQLQRLKGAFGESGVSGEKFGKAIETLNSNIEEAKGGSETAIADFEALGVTLDDLRNMSPDEVLLKIADATKEMGSAAEKTVKLSAVLGKAGKAMVGAMSQGADGIEETGRGVRVMSDETVESLDTAGDAFDRFFENIKAKSASGLAAWVEGVKFTAGKMGLGPQVANPMTSAELVAPSKAQVQAEKSDKMRAENQRLFEREIAKFQKDREKEAEQTQLELHRRRMDAEEDLAKRQDDSEKKVLDFRGKQKVQMKEMLHMLEQAKEVGGDIGGEFAAKAGQAKMDLVEAQTQRLLMSPAERVAADREARRVRQAQQKAQRMVDRQIREGKIQDAAPAMRPMAPEQRMDKAAGDLSAAAANLKGLKIVAITNQ
jgi:hypothetical protein